MWRFVLALVILLGLTGSTVYVLDRMEVIDVQAYILERMQDVPAYADYATVYQLGLERRADVEAHVAALDRERLAWEEAEHKLAEREAALQVAARALENDRHQLEKEREALDREWEALQERQTLDDNLDRLVGFYEQMDPEEVAAIAEQTSAGADEVASATEQQSEAIKNIAKTVSELSSQAEKLNETIKKFILE